MAAATAQHGRRLVITGMGAVTCLGKSKDEMWDGLVAGRSGIHPIALFDVSDHEVRIGGDVPDFDPTLKMPGRESKRIDRFAQLAMWATMEAVEDSGLDFEQTDRARAGCILGTGIGGIQEIEDQHDVWLARGPKRVSALVVPKLMANAAPGHVCIKYQLYGPCFTLSTACASATNAMGEAYHTIVRGDADIIITGGTEAAMTPLALAGFINPKAVSKRNDTPTEASRPFDKTRDGFVMSEGAGVVVFEELEHAKARGANIYAEVLGYGQSCDGHHITAPHPEGKGAALSMSRALECAGLDPSDVSYINAHGTSTQLNDAAECKAIHAVFGDHAKKLAVSSTKSMIGHLLGASGGAEIIAAAMSVKTDIVHPTINYHEPDPDCDIDVVPNVAREMPVEAALSNSFGFGGHNGTMVIGKVR